MPRIGLFSSDCKLQPLLAAAFGNEYQLMVTCDPAILAGLANQNAFDALLLDIDIEAVKPTDYFNLFRSLQGSDVSAVAMVDDSGRHVAVELVQLGAHGYCRKPPALRELKAILGRACEYTTMKRKLGAKGQLDAAEADPVLPTSGGLIGSSEPMLQVYETIRRVANLNASVLVTGESGTGKELIARAIHSLGQKRSDQPFVAVSCGAIPETLIESELFGHERGAFTGSVGSRSGFFEQAAGGTLFLDEIGELSAQTQVKLLRVLQQKEFNRLGSGRPIPMRARIIFATHRNLPKMIEEGSFRLDLYYRINVMTILAPSLATHPEDIYLLAGHFVKEYSVAYGKSVSGISPAAMRLLEVYEWPGNVRELENAIQSAIICADGVYIQPKDLPIRMRAQELSEEMDVSTSGKFERLLREYKVKLAMKAIEDNGGNKTLAARSLDISRAYLHRLIRADEVVRTIHAA